MAKEPVDGEAPPSYTPTAPAPPNGQTNPPSNIDITASFAHLAISSNPPTGIPSVDTCLAHLKLLHAIHSLKEDVGYTDGLWGLWDDRADKDTDIIVDGALPSGVDLDRLSKDEKAKLALSRLREKRWAIFLARAVDRYEAWWNAISRTKEMLTEIDMMKTHGSRYIDFPTGGAPLPWSDDLIPPLDVVMVMHAHMLNPRAFLEDSIRTNMIEYWTAGMPWLPVNNAISTDFSYNANDEAQTNWVSRTGLNWANQDDPMTKSLRCPWCKGGLEVPWTTCGTKSESESAKGTIGNGYGDGNFSHDCPSCHKTITKEVLSLSKFIQDSSLVLSKTVPMPGTILSVASGTPEIMPEPPYSLIYSRTFPNRMIQLELRSKILDLINPDAQHPSMLNVRDIIEKTTRDGQAIRRIYGNYSRARRAALPREAKIATRKMMSRYWENFSPFALDLCGAVMRQGVFIDKMVKLDWLHSPAAKATMSRLITKYGRFIDIMKKHPDKMAVPTLDVDLAWHTHQLTPRDYYDFTTKKTGKFIDHDDKIDENALSEAFEWTTKTYQSLYNEVYSECTCWYCEGKLFNISSSQKLADSFHASGSASLCPPNNSAHISAHNSVRTLDTSMLGAHAQARQQQKLDEAYRKACKRAEKKGRTLPARDQVPGQTAPAELVGTEILPPVPAEVQEDALPLTAAEELLDAEQPAVVEVVVGVEEEDVVEEEEAEDAAAVVDVEGDFAPVYFFVT
ncbi:glycine-rich domain-containing protein 1 [Trichoderma asperellum]|uniref:Glycine-rich domain-containing protein 1 n=1 Tax=Trichoderma asperellum TaxID=101201 RepID=A0A6V8QXZ9_TRIAP|nr:glycine-rich domain-containing protein 1 [Trichoderma asperellum]